MPEDADDLLADVRLALIENDYAVLRAFEGRCSLGTYVASIAHRLLADERMQTGGRWRPSAESRRAGEAAVLLEALVVRDHKPLEEALPLVRKIDPSMSRAAAENLLARLPKRTERARFVPLDDGVPEQAVGAEVVEARALAHEQTAAAETTNAVVREALSALPDNDRVLLQLRFDHGMRVSAIARAWQCDQRILYRRIETMVDRLRRQLIHAGIDADTAARLIGREESGLAFGWNEKTGCSEKTAARQTISTESGTGGEEAVP